MPARSEELQQALEIPVPDDPSLVLDSSRRLLGPNMYSDQRGAVGDGLTKVLTNPPPALSAEQVSRLAQLGIDGDRALIVEVGVGNGGAVNFRIKYVCFHLSAPT